MRWRLYRPKQKAVVFMSNPPKICSPCMALFHTCLTVVHLLLLKSSMVGCVWEVYAFGQNWQIAGTNISISISAILFKLKGPNYRPAGNPEHYSIGGHALSLFALFKKSHRAYAFMLFRDHNDSLLCYSHFRWFLPAHLSLPLLNFTKNILKMSPPPFPL